MNEPDPGCGASKKVNNRTEKDKNIYLLNLDQGSQRKETV
jgi:hypothetical protein